jgi:hypothetical protein
VCVCVCVCLNVTTTNAITLDLNLQTLFYAESFDLVRPDASILRIYEFSVALVVVRVRESVNCTEGSESRR